MSVFTDKEIEELKDTFNMCDLNQDGVIDVYELKQVLKKMDIHPTHYQVMEMIRSVDDDCSGSIDFDEFLVLMQSRVGAGGPEQDLRQAFLQFDKSKTGYITKEDLKKTMIEFDNALTDEECNAMFSEVDLDGDGRITFREFRELMRS